MKNILLLLILLTIKLNASAFQGITGPTISELAYDKKALNAQLDKVNFLINSIEKEEKIFINLPKINYAVKSEAFAARAIYSDTVIDASEYFNRQDVYIVNKNNNSKNSFTIHFATENESCIKTPFFWKPDLTFQLVHPPLFDKAEWEKLTLALQSKRKDYLANYWIFAYLKMKIDGYEIYFSINKSNCLISISIEK